jgi:hypothetical protein
MRRFSTFAFLAVIAGGPAFSEDAGSIAYLPEKDGKPAQTIRLPAGNPQAVIESLLGDRPKHCPKEAFWASAAKTEKFVNCGDGSVYEIQPYEPTDKSKYTLRLVPFLEPQPGTPED